MSVSTPLAASKQATPVLLPRPIRRVPGSITLNSDQLPVTNARLVQLVKRRNRN